MNIDIKFGTDGWRGVIADDFTFANIEKVALATVGLLKKHKKIRNGVIIGYDARFMSREFAERTAQVLAASRIRVKISDKVSSTPMVSLLTKKLNAAAGVVITASHNPSRYNGYKLKGDFGGPMHPETITQLEKHLARVLKSKMKTPALRPIEELAGKGLVQYLDMTKLYIADVKTKINVPGVCSSGFKILHDPMYGAGMGVLTQIVPSARQIHGDYNPSFGGTNPEPIEKNLGELISQVKSEHCDIGIATDGDADRIGLVDENGRFVDSHKIFSLLLKYFVEEKKLGGEVVKTVSVTEMVDRQCKKYGLKLNITPVGFKYVCRLMTERDILIGGEESGGLGVKGHLPERDGIYLGLLVAEIMVKRGKSLGELVRELTLEYGEMHFGRIDHHISMKEKEAILKRYTKGVRSIAGFPVRRLDTLDGFKLFLDDAWVLVRPSGTEPLIRFYAEAGSPEKVSKLLAGAIGG